jgi:carbon monoxide dehydrogenase subunit G
MRLVRTIVVDRPPAAFFNYLADFTTTTEWDPGTVTTVRQHGDGGVGTTYLNTSTFLGRNTELTYVVEEIVGQRLIRLRGSNNTVTAVDTITVQPMGSVTEVTYEAEFTLKGLSQLATPLLMPAFERLANRTETGMRHALNRLHSAESRGSGQSA